MENKILEIDGGVTAARGFQGSRTGSRDQKGRKKRHGYDLQ